MNSVFHEIGFYNDPMGVGFLGWIKTAKDTFFITLEGDIMRPKNDGSDPMTKEGQEPVT